MRSGLLGSIVQRASSEFCVHPRLRRFVAAFSLANYLLLLVGIPLPVPVAKDTSRPFPCQHHRCGCASADQCWRHCCCFSKEQKLAWARENNVTPPAELLAEAPHEEEDHQHACCEAKTAHHATDHAGDCCANSQVCCEHDTATRQGEQPETVIGLRALGCRGIPSLWVALTATFPPLDVQSYCAESLPREWVAIGDVYSASATLAPDAPPPRLASL